MNGPAVDVIVPIYRGLAEVQRCIDSVLASTPRTPYQLVLINDCSPEPEVTAWLRDLAATRPELLLLENAQNLGFVGTVNRGMALHLERDVVLLNSDTEVANDWLDRLYEAARSDSQVASVTPFSSNATICSFPLTCQDNPLPAGWTVAALDQVMQRANPGVRVEIPTAVGFCMYISRAALSEIGLFDQERFGRGYGEENDFCMRAAAAGWRHLLACDCFVFHEGGVSFSSESAARVEAAQQILDRLYPRYHQLVHAHIEEDPAAICRLRALVEMWRSSPRAKVLLLTHHLGGGTSKHIRELAGFLAERMDALVLRPLGGGLARLSFGADEQAPGIRIRLPEQYPQLVELLRHLGVGRVHFHHTLGLETSLWGLPRDLGVEFDVTLHDFYFINANPTQTDAQGRFTTDLEAQVGSYPLTVPLETWQQNQRPMLEGAARVIAPSAATAAIFRQHFPDARYLVAFHPDWEEGDGYPPVAATPAAPGAPLRVLAIGALSLEKGADLLEQVAELARQRALPLEFHLLGYAYRPLSDAVVTHGAYREADIAAKLAEIRPNLVWFTALWPETYSYTLSEIMRLGQPMLVPDIGAFPERVSGRPLTWIAAWGQPAEAFVEQLSAIGGELSVAGSQAREWSQQPRAEAGRFYSSD